MLTISDQEIPSFADITPFPHCAPMAAGAAFTMFLQRFQPNKSGRDFVIGDLHGMYDLLMETLDDVSFNFEKDRCFSCGDLIDRGPDSPKCISLIHQPWFFPVRGNHEDTLIEVVRGLASEKAYNSWINNGGDWHFDYPNEQMQTYADQLDSLPFLIEIELASGKRAAVCHAEFPLDHWAPDTIAADESLIVALQWSREKVQSGDNSTVTGIDDIYCGHNIIEEPVTLGNTHFIDTGAYHTNNLTIVRLT